MLRSAVLLVSLSFALTAASSVAAVSPGAKCSGTKLTVSATLARALLVCEKKAAKSSLPPTAACIDKALAGFDRRFPANATLCDIELEPDLVRQRIQDFALDARTLLHPDEGASRCDARKLGALKTATSKMLNAEASFARSRNEAKLIQALARARTGLDGGFNSAIGKGGCTTSAISADAFLLLEALIADLAKFEQPPIAVDDFFSTTEDTEATLGSPIANDFDLNGDPLQLASVAPTSQEGGTVEQLASGSVRYAPPAGFVGPDTFEYFVTDGKSTTPGVVHAVVLRGEALIDPPDPNAANGFGGSLAMDGPFLVVGAAGSDVVYVFERGDLGEWELDDTIESPFAAGSLFGNTVAIDDDRIVVGAAIAEQVAVFKRDGGDWDEEDVLTPDPGVTFSQFGNALAIRGERIAVGAPEHDCDDEDECPGEFFDGAGRVYLFEYSDGSWESDGAVREPVIAEGSRFGAAVDLKENELFVGAPASSGSDGTVYVFGRDSSGWEARQTLPGAPGDEEQFGYSLAAAGSRLLVGAPEALGSTVVPPRGAVYGYSFDDAGGDWELETTTLISPNQDSLRLGRSVDVAGPVAAAAAQEGQFTDKNAAYVFVRGMTGWTFSTSFLGAQAATPVVATSGGFVALGLDRGTAGGVLVRFVDDRIDPSALPLRDSNRFLRFFNSDALGFREDFATGEAYYATIDPNALKTTLAAWRTANGFDLGADAEAVYQNDADLNFGRRMAIRKNPDGTVASCVENYPSVEQAIVREDIIATVCMEYAPPANNQPGPFFTKFYVFDDEGDRTPIADLDQRGAKAVPGLCNVCHGGAPRPLLPNGKHDLGGNTGAGFIPWDLNNFRYSSDPAFTRDAQEEQFRKLNRAVLDTNPTEIANTVIRGWYGGGNQIDVSGTHWDGSFVPPGWKSPAAPPGSESLYLDFVAPYCRGCHLQRFDFERLPTAAQPLDFASHAEFIELAPRTIQQLFNAGTMPLARRTFEKMWSEADMNAFAAHLGVEMQRPGRPRAVVEAGFLDVQPGSLVTLSGALSLFASDFQWEFVATPGGSQASLFDAESDRAGFFADEEGSYIVKLTVGDGIAEDSTLAFVNVSASAPAPATFTTVRNDVFNKDCTGCHNANGDAKRLVLTQDSVPQGTDLYQRVLARVDPQGIVTSPLFRKPTASVLHGVGTDSWRAIQRTSSAAADCRFSTAGLRAELRTTEDGAEPRVKRALI